MSSEAIKSGALAVICILTIGALLTYAQAHQEHARAEKAWAKYSAWALTPDGISAREAQLKADYLTAFRDENCFKLHAGPDFEPSIDCPDSLKPKLQFSKPRPIKPDSVWTFSELVRAFDSETEKARYEKHKKAVLYWEVYD